MAQANWRECWASISAEVAGEGVRSRGARLLLSDRDSADPVVLVGAGSGAMEMEIEGGMDTEPGGRDGSGSGARAGAAGGRLLRGLGTAGLATWPVAAKGSIASGTATGSWGALWAAASAGWRLMAGACGVETTSRPELCEA